MVERFNGRIADVLKTNRFDSALDLEQTLMRYVYLYNTQLPQSALASKTPMLAMKEWHKSHPHLFVKRSTNHAGRNTYWRLAAIEGKAVSEIKVTTCYTYYARTPTREGRNGTPARRHSFNRYGRLLHINSAPRLQTGRQM